jgi:transposase
MKLLPVSVADDEELPKPARTEGASSRLGAIYIELPGEVRISLEGSVAPGVVRAVLMSLRQ